MKIYTKTGDDGDTGLYGGARVGKDDRKVAVYGTVDELNASLGVAASSASDEQRAFLHSLQTELFVLGAELACMPDKRDKLGLQLLDDTCVARLERRIDEQEAKLSPLSNFILPGGCPTAAHLHLSRTICRRAERELVALGRHEACRPVLLVYLNRSSDLLFVEARAANASAGLADIPWKPRG